MSTQPTFSEAIVLKAQRLLADEGRVVVDPEHPSIWWVQGSVVRKYRVHTDYSPDTRSLTYVTCTCPHGVNKGGSARCYHAAAVLLLLKESEVASDHKPMDDESPRPYLCTCGWPTRDDFENHLTSWTPSFSEHLLEKRRAV